MRILEPDLMSVIEVKEVHVFNNCMYGGERPDKNYYDQRNGYWVKKSISVDYKTDKENKHSEHGYYHLCDFGRSVYHKNPERVTLEVLLKIQGQMNKEILENGYINFSSPHFFDVVKEKDLEYYAVYNNLICDVIFHQE